jgi:hypothetical protein
MLAPAGAVAQLVAGLMNYQTAITAVALIALPFTLPFASASPKAYEGTAYYKGKGSGVRVALEYDVGWPTSCHLKITESASGKTTKFELVGGEEKAGKMRFVPVKGNDKTKEVLLEEDMYYGDWSVEPPSTMKGTYTAGGKTVEFTLTKIRVERPAGL